MFIDLPAPHGRLEGLLWEVPRAYAAVVVCHPHPQLGGNMHVHVPYRIARGLRDTGATTLRFNFRGVGRSSGTYGEGIGEQEDVVAALQFLSERFPGVPLWVAGYSFGSWVGLQAGLRDERVSALLGVGLPLDLFDFEFLAGATKPTALIQPEHDEHGDATKVEALAHRLAGPSSFVKIAGADHNFTAHLDALEGAVKNVVNVLRPAAASAQPPAA
jgi:alpha/beta superfamily hydrolase